MKDDLSRLTPAEIDGLPFGYIALSPEGTVRKYNRYEADLARKDPREVLGRNFFTEVAPCTQVKEFEGRFKSFVEDPEGPPTLTFDFMFRFHHGTQRVRIGFVRSPLGQEVIVTVNRVRDRSLPTTAKIEADPERGALLDAAGSRVIASGVDFWLSLESLFESRSDEERHRELHRLGKAWARRHVDRAEAMVQRSHTKTLREVELQVALEVLSGSLGLVGLGRFDVDLGYRAEGLLVVEHHHSPFVPLFAERDGTRCDLLAGIQAGFFSYLAGRELVGREISCGGAGSRACRFVVGTQARLERLFQESDGELLARLVGDEREEVGDAA